MATRVRILPATKSCYRLRLRVRTSEPIRSLTLGGVSAGRGLVVVVCGLPLGNAGLQNPE